MGNHASLIKQSQIPGLSAIFGTSNVPRKTILILVFSLLTYLTLRDLESIVADYFRYPITVSVLVTEARVLPFPAVTVCNLNPVHRERFCSSDLEKPENIDKILCSSLTDLFEVCKITEALEDLVQEGKDICEGKKADKKTKKRGFKKPRSPKRSGNFTRGQRRVRKPAGGRIKPNSGFQNQSITDNSEGLTSNQTDKTYFLPFFDETPFQDETPSPRRRGIRGGGGGRGGIDLLKRTVNHPMTRRLIHRKIKSIAKGIAKNLTASTRSMRRKRQVMMSELTASTQSLKSDPRAASATIRRSSSSYALPVIRQLRTPDSGSSCGRRSKREASFNLRSLLATFKSIQSGDLSGGLLQPFTVSQMIFHF